MKLKEAKETIIKNIEPFFTKNGFVRLKQSGSSFRFRKQKDHVTIFFGGGFATYVDFHKPSYGFSMQHKKVNEITRMVAEKIHLNPPERKDSSTLTVGMATKLYPVENITEATGINAIVQFEDQAIGVAQRIEKRSEEVVFPLLEKFEDLREIDRIINNLDDFWYTDWKMPFNLGGNFFIKRFIIAKLAGNPNYHKLPKRAFDSIDKLVKLKST